LGANNQDICTETARRDPNAKERANKGPQRHDPNPGHRQQKLQLQSKSCQAKVKKRRRLTKKWMHLPLIARRILWLQSRSYLWKIATNCWILWLSTVTRIFEMPKAIGLAAGNMYAQNVH